jgi:hypothetical protein
MILAMSFLTFLLSGAMLLGTIRLRLKIVREKAKLDRTVEVRKKLIAAQSRWRH